MGSNKVSPLSDENSRPVSSLVSEKTDQKSYSHPDISITEPIGYHRMMSKKKALIAEKKS